MKSTIIFPFFKPPFLTSYPYIDKVFFIKINCYLLQHRACYFWVKYQQRHPKVKILLRGRWKCQNFWEGTTHQLWHRKFSHLGMRNRPRRISKSRCTRPRFRLGSCTWRSHHCRIFRGDRSLSLARTTSGFCLPLKQLHLWSFHPKVMILLLFFLKLLQLNI